MSKPSSKTRKSKTRKSKTRKPITNKSKTIKPSPRKSKSKTRKPITNKSKKRKSSEMTELDNILDNILEIYEDNNIYYYKVESETATLLISYKEEGEVETIPEWIKYPYYEPRKIKPSKLFIHALYKNEAPSGYIRKILCLVLNKIKKDKNFLPIDRITLEASGDIDGSFLKLIQMYQRMGFEVDRTYGKNAESIYNAIKSNSYEYNSYEYETFENLTKKNMDYNVQMSQEISNLLEWCSNKKF